MHDLKEDLIPSARPVIGEAEIEAAVRVLRSRRAVQGPEVAAFEEQLSELVAGRHCVAVNSGTSALQLTLMAVGFGPSDEVIVPSFSFAAPANAVCLVGAERAASEVLSLPIVPSLTQRELERIAEAANNLEQVR